MPMTAKPKTLAAAWERLDADRSSALRRKRQHAELTIPSLLPIAGKSQHQELPVPYNGLTSEGINALAARLVSVILPLGALPIFELFVDEKFAPEGKDVTQLNNVLKRVEQAVMNRLYLTNLRPQLFLAIKHLIAIGDVLVVIKPDLDIRLHRFDEYVCKRTTEGTWRELIIREMVDPDLQPERIKSIRANQPSMHGDRNRGFPQSNGQSRKFEPIFTRLQRDGEDSPVRNAREFRGVGFDSNTQYEVAAHLPLRWNAVSGEDYGTSLVEDAFGDVRSLDGLSAGLIDGVALNSEYRWGVNPAGITEIEDLRQSVNGDWVPAVSGDVFPLNFQHAAQVEATLRAVTHREERLGRRFLMNSVVQPRGERVTARQVTIIAQELEQSLGGVLSMVNRDIIIPLIKRTMWVLAAEDNERRRLDPNAVPIFPPEFGEFVKDRDSLVKLRVRSGLELLQREAEQEKLDELISRAAAMPEAAQNVIKWESLMQRVASNIGIEPAGIIKTTQELQQEAAAAAAERQALAAQEAAQQVAINAANNPPREE